MERTRGRQRKVRKKISYDDVVTSTDLPPLVEGELRCFIFVTIGELSWGPSAHVKGRVPPASPAYIRLRWWGEATNGTYFRPLIQKNGRLIKSRAQFGIRSGPKQIAAYFNDMGSATFDVLSSPNSLPIGRVQVPGVSTLASNTPIRGFFPIISASSRKLGELQLSICFKPLKAAYDDSSDAAATDGSYSSRSRATSGGSRRNSRSRISSVGSTKSRSSSRGSRTKTRGRSRSNSDSVKRSDSQTRSGLKYRSRSGSNDSRASVASLGSKTDIPTPRGIDALLEQNGHDLYDLTRKNKGKAVHIPTTVSGPTETNESTQFDAISELLKRGKKLRDEISQSSVPVPFASSPPHSPPRHPPAHQSPQQVKIPSHATPPRASSSDPTMGPHRRSSPARPQVHEYKADTELRIVDLILKAKGMTADALATPDMSGMSSPLHSIVSDIDDPLHDESILQHLFYNQLDEASSASVNPTSTTAVQSQVTETTQTQYATSNAPQSQKLSSKTTKVRSNHQNNKSDLRRPEEKIRKLSKVCLARVTIHGLQLNASGIFDEDSRTKKHGTSRNVDPGKENKTKPPVPMPLAAKRTFFVEYKFPPTVSGYRSIAATTSSHEMTRVASRKVDKGGFVRFDQHSVFNIRFNPATVTKWCSEKLEFVIYQRKSKEKKATILGKASVALCDVIDSQSFSFSDCINVTQKNESNSFSAKHIGALKLSIDLVEDSKDLTVEMSPVKTPTPVKTPVSYTVTELVKSNSLEEPQKHHSPNNSNVEETDSKCVEESPRVCIATDHLSRGSRDNDICPRIASTVLYLYVMLNKAKGIPATRIQSGSGCCGKSCPPNVYLVTRTFASDEASKTSVVWSNNSPQFNFTQVLPVKIDNQLFLRMRDNYIVVEVWTKVPSGNTFTDKLMGLVKISLQLFYQSLKDPEIARAVLKSDFPLVSVDGFQPIVDVFSGHERGKLHLLLALGTQAQVASLRKAKNADQQNSGHDDHHLDESTSSAADGLDQKGPVQHTFELTIHGLCGFKPHNTQVWGETDCFVQYSFPTQSPMHDDSDEHGQVNCCADKEPMSLATMHSYRTDTTLCVPNPQFGFTKKHRFHPPPSVPVQRVLLSTCSNIGKYPGGGIPFEIWSRFYYPNVRDQLLAKGCLPAAKLCALVTMKKGKSSGQKYQVPLEFVDPEPGAVSAGDLRLSVKYCTSGTTLESTQPPLPFCKNVKLEVAVLRACGLKAAAKLASSLVSDNDMEYCAEVGVNSYVAVKTSFLPNDTHRRTRCIARSFTPDYNHHFELTCPVVSYHKDVTPVSLAELFANGMIELEIWHRPIPDDETIKTKTTNDILLGRVTVRTCDLLSRTTGCNGWYPITTLESLKKSSSTTVGAVELAISFSCRNDLDLILRAAKAVAWKPHFKADLNHLLAPDSSGVLKPVDEADVSDDYVTACVTVTNAWLPKKFVSLPGTDEINKHAHVYLHYKFYDKDSVTSSVCPILGASGKKTFKDHDVLPVKLAHRKSFLCRPTQPFVWHLREEFLEIQLWFSHSRSSRTSKRPFDSDKLLGTAKIDMASTLVGGLHKQQHISGLYPLFKAGTEDMCDASIRVYLSINPGDHTMPYDTDSLDDTTATLSSSTDNMPALEDRLEITVTDKETQQPTSDCSFSAIVSVERAMHLTTVPAATSLASSENAHRPTCYVTFPITEIDGKSVETTSSVVCSTCPVWDSAMEVKLDKKYLNKENGSLLFRVWQSDATELCNNATNTQRPGDQMIGFATVDISVLNSGFRAVNGWYNILDIHGNCQGQIKVAVTPTETVIGTYENIFNQSSNHQHAATPSSPNKGILHSVPLLCPVQTPSGSLYYPGVSSSQQTVGSTCKASANRASSYDQTFTQRHDRSAAFKPTHVNIDALPSIPTRAMFKYDEKQCLLGTLQRQMKELDKIKENFQQKKFHVKSQIDPNDLFRFEQRSSAQTQVTTTTSSRFPTERITSQLPPPQVPSITTTTTKLSPYPSSSTVDSFHPSPSLPIYTTPHMTVNAVTTQSESYSAQHRDLQTDELFSKLTFSTPGSKTKNSTVHMSLFKTERNPLDDFDGGALSDNELSDVEFVNPKNLNDQSIIFSEENATSPYDGCNKIVESDSSISTVEENRLAASLEDISPNSSKTGASDLNNTSLWLSASTSKIGDVSADALDNDDETSPPLLLSSQNDDHASSDLPLVATDAVESPVADDPHANSVDTSDSAAPSSTNTREDTSSDSEDHEEINGRKNVQKSYVDNGVKIQQTADSESFVLEGHRFDSDDFHEVKSSETETCSSHSPALAKPQQQSHMVRVCDQTSGESSSSPQSSGHSSSISSTRSSVLQTSPKVPRPCDEWPKIPAFFPSHQDLIESMKTLQAVTNEQKHKLLQKHSSIDKENSPSTSSNQQPRRKVGKSPRSAEQTKRLARIFQTKYNSTDSQI